VELRPQRRLLVLAICCVSLLVVSMDNTIVNVALPAIRHDLGASVSGLQWTVDAYTLVLASSLMLAGSTADRVGRRRTFQVGLAAFGAGSLLCSMAPSVGWLVTFRMIQGLGGSMLNPVAMSIISNTFTDAKERARAIGVWGAVLGIALALGPVVGGALTESVGWRSIFWINVPIVVGAIVMTARFVPESRAARARRIDPVGQLLVIVALAATVFAIIEAQHWGWGSPLILGLFVLAGAAVGGLLTYEPHRTDPLVEFRFFRSAPFSSATLIAVFAFFAFGAFLFLNTLYLQEVRGLSAFHAGLYTLPVAALAVACPPLSGRLVAGRGARLPLLVAGVAMTAGSLMLTQLSASTSVPVLMGAYLLFGLGFGMVNAPITNSAVSGMPRTQAGVASAVASTSRQVGQTLGVAVGGSIVGVGAGAAIGARLGEQFATATHPAWWVLVGCGVAILALGLASTGGWAESTTRRTADLFVEHAADAPSAGLR
jgi:EmrB/QacA subfamily drug resistance transporter